MKDERATERPPASHGLLAALFAAVRPEWRRDVIVAPEGERLFAEAECLVNGCGARAYTTKGLCRPHNFRWASAGRPDLARWVLTQDGPTRGRRALGQCEVARCEFGRKQNGLCTRHWHKWKLAGKPPREEWAASYEHDPASFAHFPRCLVDGCNLLTSAESQLCGSHNTRWETQVRAGQDPSIDAFLERVQRYGKDHVDLSHLAPQLRLELQYGLQCRADEGRLQTRLQEARPLVKLLNNTRVSSLTEKTVEEWTEIAEITPSCGQKGAAYRFLVYCLDRLDILENGAGWDTEYPRDVWRMSRLGYDSAYENLRFTRIPQTWLRELAKRWLRQRLAVGLAYQTVYLSLAAVVQLAEYLSKCSAPPQDVSELTRDHLEGWIAHLSTTVAHPATRLGYVTGVRVFLQEIHRREWAPGLASSVMLYPEDTPKLPEPEPRALPEYVMQQLEPPEQLSRYRIPDMAVITGIMMACGLRGKDARWVDFDCMVRDADNHPYLRYVNQKMKRVAFVPIDEDLVETIKAQQDRVLLRYPGGCARLFPALRANPNGDKPVPHATWFRHTKRWLEEDVKVVDKKGLPFKFKAHQWRHTFATRLINHDVPQHIVQRLLDHSTSEMTARYARLRDDKLREAWLKVRKINVNGDVVDLADEHPLADATWTRAGLAKAKQTLPNGYCGMPIQSPCEHANPCLTCPLFLTTPDFLPQHRHQRVTTLELITKAEAEGHHRVAEKNKQVLGNLDRIIAACESCGDEDVVVGGVPRPDEGSVTDAS
ncbi:hypothetical protein A5669_05130 [Mycolicibacterium fortuitum]|uniref:tyrosine-type recombinase/integrase n=1 Tax=Mycolicibacterium fortuitum TaxID=1766 RepID=UPI0007EB678D|nr:tyrosine-type recombinase/integrase [Mycolicibacterium fortuitum]OBG47701.1 hypothetical protein A5669_05130 [Mycolicibacterium fortuitum]